jgi:hypothetical protein
MNAITSNVPAAPASNDVDPGIWPTSSPSATASFIIFSVGNDILRQQQFMHWAASQGISFKPLIGCYKGQTERSFICNANWLGDLRDWLDGQESILHLGPLFRDGRGHGDRVAELEYLADGRREAIGAYGWAPRAEALRQDGWTYDPTLGEYFTCRPYPVKSSTFLPTAAAAALRSLADYRLSQWADDGGRHVQEGD